MNNVLHEFTFMLQKADEKRILNITPEEALAIAADMKVTNADAFKVGVWRKTNNTQSLTKKS